MRTPFLFFTFLFLLSLMSLPSAWSQTAPVQERVEHYNRVEPPKNKAAALTLLDQQLALIQDVLKKPKLEHSDLEAIHEASYALETVVDYFKKQRSLPADRLKKIDQAVQDLHYASEDHEEAKVRGAVDRLTQGRKDLS